MTDNPTISIALATYNGERFLGAQLESLAAQTQPPFELVVNDDCSTDRTAAIVARFARSAPFPTRLKVNHQRLGSTANFARAVERCGGTHIALSDQDDIWKVGKLETITRRFTARPELGMVFSNAERVAEDLGPLGVDLWRSIGLPRNLPAIIRSPAAGPFIVARPTVTGATMAFSARLRDLILPFPTDIPYWIHDRWASALIALASPVDCISETLVLYRQHRDQQIGATVRARPALADKMTDNCHEMQVQLQAVGRLGTRLAQHPELCRQDAVAHLAEVKAHLERRLSLPAARLRRVPGIWHELREGRYARHSSGVNSAIKDFLAR